MNPGDQVFEAGVQEATATERLRIRRYERGDKRAIRRLHDDALNEVGAHLGSGPWDQDLDEIESVYLDSGGEFLVGILNEEVVAMGALMKVSPGKAELKRMRVRPGLQGRGHGQTMLDALHRRAAELGYSTIRLDTTVQQRAAQRLYLKNGYSEAGRGSIGPFDCIFYERHVVV
jgi:ribosomal protein S18 acetylase RimI-like enzyme